jgi:hypothetical protein
MDSLIDSWMGEFAIVCMWGDNKKKYIPNQTATTAGAQ